MTLNSPHAMAKDPESLILSCLRAGEAAALATVVWREGSAPREPGAKLALAPDGALAGTVGGGLLEARALEACSMALARGGAVLLTCDMRSPDPGADLICGGLVRLLVERLGPESLGLFEAACRTGAGLGPPCAGNPIPERGRLAWLVDIRFRQMDAAADALPQRRDLPTMLPVTVDRRLVQALGAASSPGASLPSMTAAPTEAADLLALGRTAMVFSASGAMLVDPVRRPETLLLLGGGHVCLALARLADTLDFAVEVVDDRPEFANPARFPMARAVRALPGFAGACRETGPGDYVVIATRGHRHDLDALAQALEAGPRYIGMIGSLAKREAVYKELRQRGVDEASLARVCCPVGLAIGARTPEEIAVAIAAQLIGVRHGAA